MDTVKFHLGQIHFFIAFLFKVIYLQKSKECMECILMAPIYVNKRYIYYLCKTVGFQNIYYEVNFKI